MRKNKDVFEDHGTDCGKAVFFSLSLPRSGGKAGKGHASARNVPGRYTTLSNTPHMSPFIQHTRYVLVTCDGDSLRSEIHFLSWNMFFFLILFPERVLAKNRVPFFFLTVLKQSLYCSPFLSRYSRRRVYVGRRET